ncbi:hypothetical protein Tsubulata_039980 [Turnera subulata]|uniref:NAC domain-containing protein n=1 Tax=Turnera subulata TaxID=218843 RepID=A0A9Q0GAZ0_9ROSI|nr:hypothetical protein Tsubulata_039980 [Turnera subulata]
MEVEKLSSDPKGSEEDDDVTPPGFRFHPTDEELVGFYLKRKVEKKPTKIDLIKLIDVYKYEPWDLQSGGETEWYFFCRRGRKYKNSIRPNRVTGHGFWKATGIDKPIFSDGKTHECIGLKKSLVYYRGSAGKGTKTDWMMHEFRLPASRSSAVTNANTPNVHEAEVWTICRIFKREVPCHKKYLSEDTRKYSSKQSSSDSSSKSNFTASEEGHDQYVSFDVSADEVIEMNPLNDHTYETNQLYADQLGLGSGQVPYVTSYLSFSNQCGDEYSRDGNWDELRPVVDFALDSPMLYSFR